MDFVARVTTPGGPDFVPEDARIAVFDNDGTLWSEQPMYVQLAFVLDRVRALFPQHPEWRGRQPFQAAKDGDLATVAASGTRGILELVAATHGGMTTDEFEQVVRQWLKTARHPRYNRAYTELTYAPMVELLGFLRSHGFKTFIVSGGGAEFMRPWVKAADGIPPEQVVGSRVKLAWDDSASPGVLRRQSELEFIDDGPGKPVGIQQQIGRRPIFAAGNSDGDLQMLRWTAEQQGPHLAVLVHHTDAVREVAYDRSSARGHLRVALDRAIQEGWVVIDMQTDWKQIFSSPGGSVDAAVVP